MNTLHSDALVADTHNDLLCAVVARPPEQWADYFAQQWLPQLVSGGVDLQVLPVFVDEVYRPEGALRQTMRMIEAAHRIAEGNQSTVALCHDGAQIDAAVASGRIALVLALESAPGIGEDIELIRLLFRLGVRVASIAHFGRTLLADGSAEDGTGGRLTTAGVRALAEMESVGIIFDVSHLSIAGTRHVLDLATRPVLATHSSARSLLDHHRNLGDDHIRAIAATGGVVCVNFFAPFLHPTDHSVDQLVHHLEHVASVAGINHVGLGPDFVKEVLADTTPPCCEATQVQGLPADAYIPGLDGPRGLPLVTDALQDHGWTENDIRAVLGENVRRIFQAELGMPPDADEGRW